MNGNFSLWISFFYWCACLCLHKHVYVYCVSVCKHTPATACIWKSEETLGCWYMHSLQFETRSPCCCATQARLDGLGASRIPQDLLPLPLQYHRDYRHVSLCLSSQVFLVFEHKASDFDVSTLPTDPSPQLSLQYF